jgi:serine/threonine protein kinase
MFPGRDYMHQLQLIVDVLGTPTDREMDFITNPAAKTAIKTRLHASKGVVLKDMLPGADPLAIDLLEQMLLFNPDDRCTVEEALGHPYFKELHEENEEPICDAPFELEAERRYALDVGRKKGEKGEKGEQRGRERQRDSTGTVENLLRVCWCLWADQ